MNLVLATVLAAVLTVDGGSVTPDAPVLRFREPVTITTKAGLSVDAGQGFYFPQNQYEKMNKEVRPLQSVEKEHAQESGNTVAVIMGFVLGVAAGVGVAVAISNR